MYITRLHVQNMKLMRDLALDFTHEGKPRMWTAFVAENGACKTTLLQAIALVASGSDRANQPDGSRYRALYSGHNPDDWAARPDF
jgi:recombinational DNA repair ATPase RecF